MQRLKEIARRLAVFCLGLVFMVTSGWVGDGLKGECLFSLWMGECEGTYASTQILCRVLLSLIACFGSALLAYYLAKEWWPVRHIAQTRSVRAHKVLIMPISLYNPLPVQNGQQWTVAHGNTHIPLTGNLKTDIQAFTDQGFRWNGQQFLRGLEPHISANSLAHVVLIGSSGKFPSHEGLAAARALVGLYSRAEVHLHPAAVDFEDIEKLQQAFDEWIKHFRDAGIPEKEIILDTTGGQKTTSIASALTTLRWAQVEFQYVESRDAAAMASDHKPDVISFNVVVEAPQKGLA